MRSRLELLSPDLAAHLASAGVSQRRQAVLAACSFALSRSGLSEPATRAGMSVLEDGRYGEHEIVRRVERLAADLDERYFELQEAAETGSASVSDYMVYFQQARAASALLFALQEDSFKASSEVLYEAEAASADLVALTEVVLAALRSS